MRVAAADAANAASPLPRVHVYSRPCRCRCHRSAADAEVFGSYSAFFRSVLSLVVRAIILNGRNFAAGEHTATAAAAARTSIGLALHILTMKEYVRRALCEQNVGKSGQRQNYALIFADPKNNEYSKWSHLASRSSISATSPVQKAKYSLDCSQKKKKQKPQTESKLSNEKCSQKESESNLRN